MNGKKWMLYGAYGYTGTLLAEEAVRRGHRPVLAGRSSDRLKPLADRLGLASLVLDLVDEKRLAETLLDFDLVLHAAGPFTQTSTPMVHACLASGTHYLDIAGEVMVFERLLALDTQARERGIAIIPGVGFNVLATDCLVGYVSKHISHPTHLEIATSWYTDTVSPGSVKTMIDSFPVGTLMRKDGRLVRTSVRNGRRRIRFIDRERTVLPANLGDLVTAYRTTGIPDIATFTALPAENAGFYAWAEPVFQKLFSLAPLRRVAKSWVARMMRGFEPPADQKETSHAWVFARNEGGNVKEAWLETVNSYHFTALAGVRSAEKLLAEQPRGAVTPALAFGADFVLGLPGTKRLDWLGEDSQQYRRYVWNQKGHLDARVDGGA